MSIVRISGCGRSPTAPAGIQAGLAFLPMTLCIVTGSTVASRAVTRIGAKPLLVAGMVSLTPACCCSRRSRQRHVSRQRAAARCWWRSGSGCRSCRPRSWRSAGVNVPRRRAWRPDWSTPRGWSGGALGLAILAAIATSETNSTASGGHRGLAAALTSGFQVAFSGRRVCVRRRGRWPLAGCRGWPSAAFAASSRRRTPRSNHVGIGRLAEHRACPGQTGENPRRMAHCFVTRELPGPALDRLRAAHEVEVWPERLAASPGSCCASARRRRGPADPADRPGRRRAARRAARACGDRQLRGRLRQHRPRRRARARDPRSATRPTC